MKMKGNSQRLDPDKKSLHAVLVAPACLME